MNKKARGWEMSLIFIVVTILVLGYIYWYLPHLKEEATLSGEVCGDFTSVDGISYTCCKDCEKLNLDYFRYEYSGALFGASISNCYCKDNNDVKQIW